MWTLVAFYQPQIRLFKISYSISLIILICHLNYSRLNVYLITFLFVFLIITDVKLIDFNGLVPLCPRLISKEKDHFAPNELFLICSWQ